MDTRPRDDGGGKVMRVLERCGTGGVTSFSWESYDLHIQSVFCPNWVTHWSMFGDLSTFRASRGRSVPILKDITQHMTDVARSFMTPTVLQELSLSTQILGIHVLSELPFPYLFF